MKSSIVRDFNLPTIKRALRHMGHAEAPFMLLLFGFCAVEMLGSILYTIGLRGVINAVTLKDWPAFQMPMLLIILSHAIWWIYAPISTYYIGRISHSTMRDYKANLCGHIMRLPMRVHDSKPTGEFISAVSNDAACMAGIYDWSLFDVLHSISGGAFGVIIMLCIDWRFALIVTTLGGASVLISARFSRKLETAGAQRQQSLARTSTDIYELIKAAKTIRTLHLQQRKQADCECLTAEEAGIRLNIGQLTALMNGLTALTASLTYVTILFIGTLMVRLGLSDWGTVMALLSLKGTTDMLFVECGQFIGKMQAELAGVKRLNQLDDLPEEKAANLSAQLTTTEGNVLELRNVTFAYEGGKNVLSGFNLALPERGLTILAGESGAGKSTIVKLMLGLYPPDNGEIALSSELAGGVRENCAYVPQQATLFHGSVFDNIAFGSEYASMADVQRAALYAQADSFIRELDNGYDTVLSDDGKTLSGGQQQRIAIARALMKDAPILLLDEITSGLDSETELDILSTIIELSEIRSVLLVTHRQGTFKFANRLVVL